MSWKRTDKTAGTIPIELATWLDLVRVSAAVIVLMSHAWGQFVPSQPLPWPSHQAVVVFFVISGFVIAHVSTTKEIQFQDYALSRAARILSVSVPSLALSLFVAWYVGASPASAAARALVNLFFLGQCWFLDITPITNQPYWSLCYEVAYYLIFAAAVYPRKRGAKVLWTGAACLLAGPKILLLMPCWLCGVLVYRNLYRFSLSQDAARGLFLITVVSYALFFWFDLAVDIRETMDAYAPQLLEGLSWSRLFVGDFILALIVSANFVAVANLRWATMGRFTSLRAAIKKCAAFTFSLYLYHQPVGIWLKHFGAMGWLAVLATLFIPIILSPLTEQRRAALKRAFVSLRMVPRVP